MRKVAVGLIFLVFFSCSEKNGTEELKGLKVFRFNITEPFVNLDPVQAVSSGSKWAVQHLYNGLTEIESDLKAKASLAEEIDVAPGGRQYAFRLRNNVFFHNDPCFPGGKGRKVTARDVAFSLNRVINSNNPVAVRLGEYLSQSSGWIRVFREDSLVISLEKPFPELLKALAHPAYSIVPQEAVTRYGEEFNKNPVGTGPFYLHSRGGGMLLMKNESYWKTDQYGKSLPYLDAVDVSFITDSNQALLTFLQKDLDLLVGTAPSSVELLLNSKGEIRQEWAGMFLLQKLKGLPVDYLTIHPSESADDPLHNRHFRQALSFAIDRKALTEYVYQRVGDPGNSGITPPILHKYTLRGYHHDTEKSRILLEKAGIDPEAIDPIKLVVDLPYKVLGEFIRDQWSRIGIEVDVVLADRAGDNQGTIRHVSLDPDFPSLLSYLNQLSLEIKDEEYTAYLNEIATQPADSLDISLFRSMEERLLENCPAIVLVYNEEIRIIQNNVVGLELNPSNVPMLEHVNFTDGVFVPDVRMDDSI